MLSPRLKLNIFLVIASLPGLAFLILLGWLVTFFNTKELYGYVDRAGKFAIPPQYDWATDFKNERANVSIIGPVKDFSNGVILDFEPDPNGGLYSFQINKQGLRVSKVEYNLIPYYGSRAFEIEPSRGYGNQCNSDLVPYYYPKHPGDLTGYKHREKEMEELRTSEWVIPPKFYKATCFNGRAAWVLGQIKLTNGYQGKAGWGLINKKGEYLLPPKCIEASDFHEGLALCKVKVYFGILY